MEKFDVLIVGAGPAGSSCAWHLRSSGLRVGLIDRCKFPREKLCAGWVTPPVWEMLKVEPSEYAQGRTLQPFDGFRVGVIGGPDTIVTYGRTVSHGVRRWEFDDFLLRRSEAVCLLGEAVQSIRRESNGWLLNEKWWGRVLVGAGGHFCPVARMLGARKVEGASVVVAQEVEFQVPTEEREGVPTKPSVPEIYFCRDLQGYGWCVRKGEFLNVGLGRLDKHELKRHVQEFCQFLQVARGLKVSLPNRFGGHAYQIYERVQPKLFDEQVVLIGDAAGLAFPESGEGIRPAVESGLLAAQTLLECNGNFSKDNLRAYHRAIQQRFGPPRSSGYSEWLPAGLVQTAARFLLSSRWFARRVVLDQWFLQKDRPPFTPSTFK